MYRDSNARSSSVTSVLSDPDLGDEEWRPRRDDRDESPHLWDTRALDARRLRAELDLDDELEAEFGHRDGASRPGWRPEAAADREVWDEASAGGSDLGQDLEPLDLPYPSNNAPSSGFAFGDDLDDPDVHDLDRDRAFMPPPRRRMAEPPEHEPAPHRIRQPHRTRERRRTRESARESRTEFLPQLQDFRPESEDLLPEPAPEPPPRIPAAATPSPRTPAIVTPPPDLFLEPEPEPAGRRYDARVRRTRWREDMISGLLSVALAAGLFLDGWRDLNLLGGLNGPSLSSWQGLLYVAFAANALYSLTRNQRRTSWSPRSIPPGYRLGALGLLLGLVALVGDAFWHTLFGEEQGLSRLISPFHLMLFLSLFLLSSSSFRSRWMAPTPRRVKRLQSFLPALCSAIAATSLVAFTVQYAFPLVLWARPGPEVLPDNPQFLELLQIDGLMSVVVMNLVLMAPVLLILKRWHPPFGTVTWLFGGVAVLMASLTEFTRLGAVVATLAGGLVADLLIRYWRSGQRRPSDNHMVAAVVPIALWTAHYLSLAFSGQAPSDVRVLFGAIALASVSSVGLSMLMNTPAIPIPVMGERTGELPPPPRAKDFSLAWEGRGAG